MKETAASKAKISRLVEPRQDPWHPVEAQFGQNDYFDILGDESIHPIRMAKDIPDWLKGFPGHFANRKYEQYEIRMLARKRHVIPHYKYNRPRDWLDVKKRLDHLYNYLSVRSEPPEFEDY